MFFNVKQQNLIVGKRPYFCVGIKGSLSPQRWFWAFLFAKIIYVNTLSIVDPNIEHPSKHLLYKFDDQFHPPSEKNNSDSPQPL